MHKEIFSDECSAAADKEKAAKIVALRQPVCDEEAERSLEKMAADDLRVFTPEGTEVGEFRKPLGKAFGFVNNAFVDPKMAEAMKQGSEYAVKVAQGHKGLRAVRFVLLHEYVSWHHKEYLDAIKRDISESNLRDAGWLEKEPSSMMRWEGMKSAAKDAGFKLLEIQLCTLSTNYGGRGVDTYKIEGSIDSDGANRLIDALHLRHAAKDDGCPYDHGHDHIYLIAGGFENRWCGPWTD